LAPRGLVSGINSARPNSLARRCAPAFIVKLSSVAVRPARKTSKALGAGGRKRPKRMGRPISTDSWRWKR